MSVQGMLFHLNNMNRNLITRLLAGVGLTIFLATSHGKTLQSRSGQFVISWANDPLSTPYLNTLERRRGFIALTPDLISLTAERIKDGIMEALGLQDTWRNKIRITISTGSSKAQSFVTFPARYSNGWGYRVLLKTKISEDIWIRNLVHVILMEMVNRPSPEHMCDPPAWLVEGLRQYVVHSSLTDHSLTVDDMVEVGDLNGRLGKPVPWFYKRNPTFLAKEFLRKNNPLTAEQIFQASSELASTSNFRHSAHLMFAELLQTPQGVDSMHRFVELLTQYFNAQTAFHQAYSDSFPNMLELEKWWAVITASVTQFNDRRRWDMAKSLSELGAILNPQAKVAIDKESLPAWRQFTFQDILAYWRGEERISTLDHISRQLQMLKAQSLLEVIPLVDKYMVFIREFKDQLGRVGFSPKQRGQLILRESQVINNGLRRLANLEQEREAFLAKYKALDDLATAPDTNRSAR